MLTHLTRDQVQRIGLIDQPYVVSQPTPLLYLPHLLNVIGRHPMSQWLIIHFLLSNYNPFLQTYRWQLRSRRSSLRRTTERGFFKRKSKLKFERKHKISNDRFNKHWTALLAIARNSQLYLCQNDQFVIFVGCYALLQMYFWRFKWLFVKCINKSLCA